MSDRLYQLLSHSACVERLQGSVIHAPLTRTFIGERCRVRDRHGQVICGAQTVGFTEHGAVLSLIGSSERVSRECVVEPSGQPFELTVDDGLLGAIVDADGVRKGRLTCGAAPSHSLCADAEIAERRAVRDALSSSDASDASDGAARFVKKHRVPVERAAPEFDERRPVDRRFTTGVRAIDALLPCGVGQRVGIFAPAGGGKTSLMSMLIAHADADVFVIALVGERGREVADFVAGGLPADKVGRTVLIYATSDRSPLERRNAALVATSIAEYFRDQGRHVLLMVDSMTRYARALRDVALSAGEAPARRGYPASVFEALPRLLERSGNTTRGAITAFYTVLLEDDDQADPIGDEVRSILDGHIYLSKSLASRGHYPAIDVLRSASRVASHVADRQDLASAGQFRDKLARLDELQLMLDLGEYRAGENAQTDALFDIKPALNAFLQQRTDAASAIDETLQQLHELE